MTIKNRTLVFWMVGLLAYTSVFVTVFVLFNEYGNVSSLPAIEGRSEGPDHFSKLKSILAAADEAADISGVLLPLAPDDGHLPGSHELWAEFPSKEAGSRSILDDGEFSGLQAAENIMDFSKGAISELYLSGGFVRAIRRGTSLFVLNSLDTVQVVDCEKPWAPKISGNLPYRHVKQMEMVGNVAYLLLTRLGTWHDSMVVVDLEDPLKPRELGEFNLPKETMSFFFVGRQLEVYTSTKGFKAEHVVYLYDLSADYQLIPLGRAKSPAIGNQFLQFGDHLLSAGSQSGLQILDFSQPLNPVVASNLAFPAQVTKLARYGDVLFAQTRQKNVYVVDLRDLDSPVVAKVVKGANHAALLMEFGEYTYYFTENGYVRVFDLQPLDFLSMAEQKVSGFKGELLPNPGGAGFVWLGSDQESLHAAITEPLLLPDDLQIVDALHWQGGMVLLSADGQVSYFKKSPQSELELQNSIQLPAGQRWLAASSDRMYVGGKKVISVLARSGSSFAVSGQIESSAEESWDGLVMEDILCVAAGTDGVLSYSLEVPDLPSPNPAWLLPRHLQPLADVRQFSSFDGRRLFAGAGPAGLVSGSLDQNGRFRVDGVLGFLSPVLSLAAIEGFCLVSTGNKVSVVDIGEGNSMQNLGDVRFQGAQKLLSASSEFWAGYVPDAGWFFFPVPHIVLPGQFASLPIVREAALSSQPQFRYRLNLFDDDGVISVPGLLALSALPSQQPTGMAHDDR